MFCDLQSLFRSVPTAFGFKIPPAYRQPIFLFLMQRDIQK